MRRRVILATAAAAGVAVTLLTVPATASADVSDARLIVSLEATGEPIPQELIGANHRWPDNGLGMWDAETNAPDPTMVELSKRAGVAGVRYPGGTVANLFHWKKAIGPQAERGCQVGGGFVGGREPMDSVYGVEEHQRFVEQIGATTQIMANSSTSTVAEIADFVEYMNAPLGQNPNGGTAWAQVRSDNGHPEPYDVHWWELGNELYLSNQFYWRSSDLDLSMRQYAFGGTHRQVGQALGTECDYRPSAGVSNGAPGLRLRVNFPPVVPGSQTVHVDGQAWREVADISAAGPGETVYTIDAATGWVRFGDGLHGAIPPAGAAVTADYDSGPHPGFVDYYAAMKAVDSSIQICSAWETPAFVELMGDDHPYDCLAPHLYSHPHLDVAYEDIYDQMMNAGHEVFGEIRALRKAVAQHRPNNPPTFQVSEYGTIARSGPGPYGWNGSVMDALHVAEMLAGFVDHGVRAASFSNLNADRRTLGNLFGGAVPNFHYTARANVLELYSHLVGTRPVGVAVPDNPRATGNGGYQALKVVATRAEDGTVRIIVLNRDRERAVATRLQVDGLTGAATARVSTLNGPNYSSYNSPQEPDVVKIETGQTDLPGRAFTHEFPAHSVTLLEIPAA